MTQRVPGHANLPQGISVDGKRIVIIPGRGISVRKVRTQFTRPILNSKNLIFAGVLIVGILAVLWVYWWERRIGKNEQNIAGSTTDDGNKVSEGMSNIANYDLRPHASALIEGKGCCQSERFKCCVNGLEDFGYFNEGVFGFFSQFDSVSLSGKDRTLDLSLMRELEVKGDSYLVIGQDSSEEIKFLIKQSDITNIYELVSDREVWLVDEFNNFLSLRNAAEKVSEKV